MTTYNKASLSDLADHMDKEASKLQHYSTIIHDFLQAGHGGQSLVITRSFLSKLPAVLNTPLHQLFNREVVR